MSSIEDRFDELKWDLVKQRHSDPIFWLMLDEFIEYIEEQVKKGRPVKLGDRVYDLQRKVDYPPIPMQIHDKAIRMTEIEALARKRLPITIGDETYLPMASNSVRHRGDSE